MEQGAITGPVPWEKITIAPMMDITDRRFRYFMRLLNKQVRLYTEMVVSHAIIHGNRDRLLGFDREEHPVVLQIGGSEPGLMAEAARIGASYGYDGIDVNCGCPSDRVGSGNFGACLMAQPELVRDVVAAIVAAVDVPVSVKCRIGITGEESEEKLLRFATLVFAAGATRLTVHARTATLGGLSPKQNREIPPLRYDWVYRLKQHFQDQEIEINGGFRTAAQIHDALQHVDRVMMGRLAHDDPFFFYDGDRENAAARWNILHEMAQYAGREGITEISAARFFHTMLNIYTGIPGARRMRQFLSEEGRSLTPLQAVAQLRDLQIVPVA